MKGERMRCYGDFKNDRTCDMCRHLRMFDDCEEESARRMEKLKKELAEKKYIEDHCEHRSRCWDEYTEFWGCTLNGYKMRDTPYCEPKEKCKQYLKESKK